MKIGIDARCLEWERGGVARILANMLRIWPTMTRQHTFDLYFQNGAPADDYLRNPLYRLRIIRGPKFIKRRPALCEQFLLPLEIRRDKPDLFFAPCYTAPLWCPCPKMVVAAWDISYTTHRSHYRWRPALETSILSRLACRRAAGVITCSPYDGRQIERYYKIHHERICVLQLAADDKFRQPADPRALEALREKYNLPKRYLLSMGVILNRRNVPVIIDAFKEICRDFPDVGLVVAGRNSTEPRADIEALMRALTERGQGLYIPKVPEDELVPFYAGAWYYICTSTVDGEALMLKEAMRCGTPVITSPLLQETVEGHAVILQDPTSRPQIAEVFRRVLAESDLRARLARAGQQWVQTLSWSQVALAAMRFIESR